MPRSKKVTCPVCGGAGEITVSRLTLAPYHNVTFKDRKKWKRYGFTAVRRCPLCYGACDVDEELSIAFSLTFTDKVDFFEDIEELRKTYRRAQ